MNNPYSKNSLSTNYYDLHRYKPAAGSGINTTN